MVENAIQFIRIGRTNASGAFVCAKSKVVTLKQSVMAKNQIIDYQDHKREFSPNAKEDVRIKYVLTLKFLQVYGTFCFEVLVWVDT